MPLDNTPLTRAFTPLNRYFVYKAKDEKRFHASSFGLNIKYALTKWSVGLGDEFNAVMFVLAEGVWHARAGRSYNCLYEAEMSAIGAGQSHLFDGESKTFRSVKGGET